MKNLNENIRIYLYHCETRKNLNEKTIKAYRIDLAQYASFTLEKFHDPLSKEALTAYVSFLHIHYQPKTVKRKIACLKTFTRFLFMEDLIPLDPFQKIYLAYREPIKLPKTIPAPVIAALLSHLYSAKENAQTDFQKATCLRDIAVIELLFATGMRISELCSLKISNLNLTERKVLIYGKGAKERVIYIGSEEVVAILNTYLATFSDSLTSDSWLFLNQRKDRLSEQSVRNMIGKYARQAGIQQHITPHMFRHSFATLLLESDVDIRYIQKLLGHSSITTTEIYTQVSLRKQQEILCTKHPRNGMEVNGG